MKKFVEKLIGRLEEEHERCINQYGVVGGNIPASIVRKCMNITEELAEEYSTDIPQKSANGWIPCSERLPEEKGEYLVTLKTGVVTSAIYDSNENKWVDAMEEYFEYPCIAWQPLPQSYKPQELEWKDKVMKHFTNVE